MKLYRVKAIFMQELYVTIHSLETLNDVFGIALINFLLFGFLSFYLIGSNHSRSAQYLLMGMVLWEIIRIVQYSVSVGTLWNIWSRNLSNLFISPLSITEYFVAHTLSGVVKGLGVAFMASIAAYYLFHFDIYQLGFVNLFFLAFNLILFGFATGIAIVGLIFRYGTKIQALSWSIIPIIQPLSANFYPLSIMPRPLQIFAYIFPPTFVFEGARYGLVHHAVLWQYIGIAFFENVIYVTLGIWVFRLLFASSKASGQFARNES